jgi:zinc protease
VRAEVPPPPDVNGLVQDYKSSVNTARGEEFDPSPENIDKKNIRTDLKGGPKLSLLSKKSRGEQVNMAINLRFGDETSLKGHSTEAGVSAQMLMRGTVRHTRQQIKDEFDRLKAQVGISGGAGAASATIQTTRENLKPVLDLVAEVFKEPSFPQNEFEELKQLALASLENQKSNPQAMASIAMNRHLSPYSKEDVRYVPSLDERIEDMKALSLEKVKLFHKDFYGGSDSLITVVGDFDAAAVQKQVSDLFETWKSPKKFVRIDNKYQKLALKAEVFQAPDKPNAMWIAAGAFQMTDTDPDYAALTPGRLHFREQSHELAPLRPDTEQRGVELRRRRSVRNSDSGRYGGAVCLCYLRPAECAQGRGNI